MQKLILIYFFLSTSLVADESYRLKTPHGGDFALETSLSKSFMLSDLKGKTVFLYFGFTQCPSVCPVTVHRLKKLNQELQKRKINDVHFLFISVDNERDNLQTLTKYAHQNGKLFSAGTTTDDRLKSIMELFGGRFSKTKNVRNQLIIDHSDNVYIISPNGKWVETLRYNRPYQDYFKAYQKAKEYDKNFNDWIQLRSSQEIKLLGKNETCDLGKTACSFFLPGENGVKEELKVSFSPYPIKSEKDFKISIESASKKYIPREMDFEGITQNMGLIRPLFKKTGSTNYTAETYLPMCEKQDMKWRIRLTLEGQSSTLSYLEFFLETKN